MTQQQKKYFTLLAWVVAFEGVSYLIGNVTQGDVNGWYRSLVRPPLVPPDIVFPVVWTLLYILIAAAGWTIWNARKNPECKPLVRVFAIYMALNWSWSFVFFSAHQILPGFLWIIVMNAVALGLIIKSWRPLRPAALLMIPPTLWTFFAAYLNGGYWWLNGS